MNTTNRLAQGLLAIVLATGCGVTDPADSAQAGLDAPRTEHRIERDGILFVVRADDAIVEDHARGVIVEVTRSARGTFVARLNGGKTYDLTVPPPGDELADAAAEMTRMAPYLRGLEEAVHSGSGSAGADAANGSMSAFELEECSWWATLGACTTTVGCLVVGALPPPCWAAGVVCAACLGVEYQGPISEAVGKIVAAACEAFPWIPGCD